MENQQQNDETKSNGIELLENVIKSNEKTVASNEENIEQCVKVQFDIEDLMSSFKHMQTDLREVKTKYSEVVEFYEIEQSKRAEFLTNVPTKIEAVLSQETIDFYGNLEKRMKRKEKIIWSGFGTFILGIFTMILSINFASNWYKESIKAKSEIRQDILNEIADEGKKIYNENEITILRENTEIMQLWMKNNPKKAEDFLRFKEGFEARKEYQ
jgi:asparagine synthetase A